MGILKKVYQAVWNFLISYAEHRAEYLRHRGITGLY